MLGSAFVGGGRRTWRVSFYDPENPRLVHVLVTSLEAQSTRSDDRDGPLHSRRTARFNTTPPYPPPRSPRAAEILRLVVLLALVPAVAAASAAGPKLAPTSLYADTGVRLDGRRLDGNAVSLRGEHDEPSSRPGRRACRCGRSRRCRTSSRRRAAGSRPALTASRRMTCTATRPTTPSTASRPTAPCGFRTASRLVRFRRRARVRHRGTVRVRPRRRHRTLRRGRAERRGRVCDRRGRRGFASRHRIPAPAARTRSVRRSGTACSGRAGHRGSRRGRPAARSS